MDIIHLTNIHAECIIGELDWERTTRQPIVCDLDLFVDCSRSGISDALADTIDYAAVAARAVEFLTTSQFHMIEALAEQLAATLLQEFHPHQIRVSIWKSAHFPSTERVGITITRPRL